MMESIPARLHRDFARVHELVLHCWEVTRKTWAQKEDTRSDLALSRKTLAMFLMLLYFPRLLTTIDTASPDSAMSQLKSNFDLRHLPRIQASLRRRVASVWCAASF